MVWTHLLVGVGSRGLGLSEATVSVLDPRPGRMAWLLASQRCQAGSLPEPRPPSADRGPFGTVTLVPRRRAGPPGAQVRPGHWQCGLESSGTPEVAGSARARRARAVEAGPDRAGRQAKSGRGCGGASQLPPALWSQERHEGRGRHWQPPGAFEFGTSGAVPAAGH
jgi:hypothetical protein